MSGTLRIGLAGLGVVGGGVLKLLEKQRALLQSRCGRRLEVVALSARDRGRQRDCDISSLKWVENAVELGEDPDVDVVCELIGGSDGIALELSQTALHNGKAYSQQQADCRTRDQDLAEEDSHRGEISRRHVLGDKAPEGRQCAESAHERQ